MSEGRHESPIYDELVRQRGDVVDEARTAESEARSQVEEALRSLRDVGRPANTGWFT